MSGQVSFDQLIEQVSSCLPQYLQRFGRDTSAKNFTCINPSHQDSHTSCGLVPGTDVFKCFSCQASGNIFTAANLLENKPLSGPGFVTDNLLYLAEMFGLQADAIDMSSKQREFAQIRQAYSDAAGIIRSARRSKVVQAKIDAYG